MSVNSFKVGDKIWFNGEKRIVVSKPWKNLMLLNNSRFLLVGGYEIKPIKTCYATLGKKGV